ncbi:MAG TPA: type I glyceraldehyde-3-phosphate dehydrogenase [Alphaproteobacteria bacterium]|nr:type I glyceraldehyde-3-phosphate dehydrogenase [Alphaproteobacteria bacterium]
MAVRVAINGFGRIGRHVLRAAFEAERKDIKFVAINDLGSIDMNARMLKHDSVHGPFPGKIKVTETGIDLGHGVIQVIAERDPANLPWKELDIDVVLECTGIFTSKETAQKHIEAGARRVLISAPASGVDLTVVYGVNDDKLNDTHKIVSNASCTTNCLAPVAAALHHAFGIETGYMTTVHAYTGDQRLVDTLHKDPRRARAAALSMIPTTTGAAKAVGLVIPELKGKLDGTAIRVPTPNVSMIDFKFVPKKPATVEAVNEAMIEAAKSNRLQGILETTDEELVSTDFNHNPASSTFDLTQTQVIDGKLVRVLAWYDNEWGFANRMADVAVLMGKLK